jgi:hypothetical protein
LRGSIHLRIDDPANPRRRDLRLDHPGALPLQAHGRFRIEAQLNRPAYRYVFWLGADGKVTPLYPWKDHNWSTRPADEQKVTRIELPEIVDQTLEIPASSPGLETLVLLAREDTPLPRDAEAKLSEGLADSPVAMPLGMSQAIWLEDGLEVVFEPPHGPGGKGRGTADLSRGIPSPHTRKSDDSVLRMRAILGSQLQPLGSYSQAVLFPNVGS